MTQLSFLGIGGNLRHVSRNMGLLRKSFQIMPADSKLEITYISDIPFYNEDIPKPDSVKRFIEKAEKTDGFVFASPEYNYSLAPALKNAIYWLSREPDLKPVKGSKM